MGRCGFWGHFCLGCVCYCFASAHHLSNVQFHSDPDNVNSKECACPSFAIEDTLMLVQHSK